MARFGKRASRLSFASLLAMLGFETDSKTPPVATREWMEWLAGKPLARPTLRPRATRGWHQKSVRRGTINYAKAVRRAQRLGIPVGQEVGRCLARSTA